MEKSETAAAKTESTAPAADTRPLAMVLVTDQYRCERLITAGRRLADREGCQLEVVHVSCGGVEGDPQAMEYLFQASRERDAMMTVHYSRGARPDRFLARLIQRQRPAAVVTGLPGEGSSLLPRLWTRFSEVDFYMVDQHGAMRSVTVADRAAVGGAAPAGLPHTAP